METMKQFPYVSPPYLNQRHVLELLRQAFLSSVVFPWKERVILLEPTKGREKGERENDECG